MVESEKGGADNAECDRDLGCLLFEEGKEAKRRGSCETDREGGKNRDKEEM